MSQQSDEHVGPKRDEMRKCLNSISFTLDIAVDQIQWGYQRYKQNSDNPELCEREKLNEKRKQIHEAAVYAKLLSDQLQTENETQNTLVNLKRYLRNTGAGGAAETIEKIPVSTLQKAYNLSKDVMKFEDRAWVEMVEDWHSAWHDYHTISEVERPTYTDDVDALKYSLTVSQFIHEIRGEIPETELRDGTE